MVHLDERHERPGFNQLRAWLVHLYTGVGLAIGLLALSAAVKGDAQQMFLLLIVACLIDATDGPLARRFNVLRWTPQFDGRKLDDITDYLNYTFIPIFFTYSSGLLSTAWLPVGFLVLLVSAYGFCHSSAKTDEGNFTGFPNYWNVVVFYLYVLNASTPVAAAILLIFAALVFVRIEYVPVLNPPIYQGLNAALFLIWMITVGIILWNFAAPDPRVVYVSLIFPLYHLALCFWLHLRRRAG